MSIPFLSAIYMSQQMLAINKGQLPRHAVGGPTISFIMVYDVETVVYQS